MSTLNETPSANRLHIGIFGKTNSGKSSFINAFVGQDVSIVSEMKGTTTDPVHKAMEIHPLGACVLIDTAGFSDETELGKAREEKTQKAVEKCDIGIILISADSAEAGDSNPLKEMQRDLSLEYEWANRLKERKIPILFLVNKKDRMPEEASELVRRIMEEQKTENVLGVSALTRDGIGEVKQMLARLLPEDYDAQSLVGGLVKEDDVVVLVMPQDIQAPKGRLILPQVQTIRDLLDNRCLVFCTTTDRFIKTLDSLKKAPELIITDSQVFDYVYQNRPEESRLTSFSVLMAAFKGDLPYYVESAKMIDSLNDESKVLIAECCTHAPLAEDIGRVKIPRMLRSKFGENMQIDVVSGTDFPTDPSGYDLIIQCGACMFNRKYVMSRIDSARDKEVPMTNYGVTIAHLTGILDKITY